MTVEAPQIIQWKQTVTKTYEGGCHNYSQYTLNEYSVPGVGKHIGLHQVTQVP